MLFNRATARLLPTCGLCADNDQIHRRNGRLPHQRDDVDGCIAAALKWSDKASDARIRLYSQYRLDSHKRLLGMKGTASLPTAPYVKSALGNTRTAAALPPATWSNTFAERFGRPRAYDWSDVHHIIPGTMLTHALAQGDI